MAKRMTAGKLTEIIATKGTWKGKVDKVIVKRLIVLRDRATLEAAAERLCQACERLIEGHDRCSEQDRENCTYYSAILRDEED